MSDGLAAQLKSFLLPLTALVIIPGVILWGTGFRLGWGLGWPWDAVVVLAGAVIMGEGLYYLFMTIQLFIYIGRGTLAPWAPPTKLVIIGPYRHVRNPMISSVLIVLLGQSIAFGSVWVFVWCLLFFGINHVYFVFSEEPGLEHRFGQEYEKYMRNVPRWIPRLYPWDGT